MITIVPGDQLTNSGVCRAPQFSSGIPKTPNVSMCKTSTFMKSPLELVEELQPSGKICTINYSQIHASLHTTGNIFVKRRILQGVRAFSTPFSLVLLYAA
jgi:hypothetical protein